jgi:hypothetical protein
MEVRRTRSHQNSAAPKGAIEVVIGEPVVLIRGLRLEPIKPGRRDRQASRPR